MDGFPIYGALPEKVAERELDECNGRIVQGEYRYHLRYFRKEDMMKPYCSELHGGAATNWRWIMGCFHGDQSASSVVQQTGEIEGNCRSPDSVVRSAKYGRLHAESEQKHEYPAAMRQVREKEVALGTCLRAAAKQVAMPGDRFYHWERQCYNQRRDAVAYPLAVVIVNSTSQVVDRH